MGPIEDMTRDELASMVSAVPVDVPTAALSTFTTREHRALLTGRIAAATAAMECRIVCGVELDRADGCASRGSN